MKNTLYRLTAVLFLFAATILSAREVPPLSGPVNDYAAILSADEKETLESFLLALDRQTGVQIAVLTIPSLEGESLESFSLKTVEQWKLGQQGEDNGALLLVSLEDRAVRIETGYGLEGTLTDAKSGLIIRNVIAPRFREGKYGAGVLEAVRNMAGIATDNREIIAESVKNPQKEKSGGNLAGLLFFIVFYLIMRRDFTDGAAFLPDCCWAVCLADGAAEAASPAAVLAASPEAASAAVAEVSAAAALPGAGNQKKQYPQGIIPDRQDRQLRGVP